MYECVCPSVIESDEICKALTGNKGHLTYTTCSRNDRNMGLSSHVMVDSIYEFR